VNVKGGSGRSGPAASSVLMLQFAQVFERVHLFCRLPR
jgi:hypothetical protein